jgi:hypothetical protein
LLFVTKFNGYKLLAQNDVTRYRPSARGDDNGWMRVEEVPLIMIEFHRRGVLAFHHRKQALEFFDARETGEDGMPPGAYRNPGIASDPEFEGALYEGSDHWMLFSTFDICEEQGYDPILCAEYEKQRESPQESVIAGFYALAEKQKETAAAMEQLTVRG